MISNSGGTQRKRDASTPPPAIIVGKIYAEWCGHCTALIPEWNKLLKEFKNDARIKFVKFGDTEKNKNLGVTVEGQIADFNLKHNTQLASSGYPTIFIYYGDKLEYYNGERNQFEMSKWIRSCLANLPKQMKGGKASSRRSKGTRKTWFDRIFATRRSRGKTARKMV